MAPLGPSRYRLDLFQPRSGTERADRGTATSSMGRTVGMYELPHREVTRAFAIIDEWRDLRIAGYRAFIDRKIGDGRMQFHNP